jgi:FkbM family methyltransferase
MMWPPMSAASLEILVGLPNRAARVVGHAAKTAGGYQAVPPAVIPPSWSGAQILCDSSPAVSARVKGYTLRGRILTVRYMSEEFATQVPVRFELHGYELAVPSRHVLLRYQAPGSDEYQPYREQGLIQVVTALEQLHRRGVAVDVGANIGDTLAIIARYGTLDIFCVEPSDFFLPYLRHNIARHFADRAKAADWFITAHDDEPGQALYHWGGTAKPIDRPYSELSAIMPIGRLFSEVTDVALLKVDTDGGDLAIIEGCLDVQAPTFPIYFELEITTADQGEAKASCTRAQRFFSRMTDAGYQQAFVWDDPGRFYGRIDLSADMAVKNLLNYLTQLRHRPIWGFDICLTHNSDSAMKETLSKLISEDLSIPLD